MSYSDAVQLIEAIAHASEVFLNDIDGYKRVHLIIISEGIIQGFITKLKD